ncbi:MAG: ATP synthase subunit I [Desulfovibrionaceae bacterium]|nr:ATP synthase subunit I [Desulfovibrionaceae bacterium]
MRASLLILSPVWGAVLGLVYFGGLWLTVTRLAGAKNPRRLWALSFAARLILSLAGFWAALRVGPAALFLCLAGFLVLRAVLVSRAGTGREALPWT